MLELKIDHLNLNMENAAGHEHRVRPVAERAVALLSNRLEARWAVEGWAPRAAELDHLDIQPLSLNLNGVSDEQAAQAIADALFDALALKLKV
jgi:hypothetical protein